MSMPTAAPAPLVALAEHLARRLRDDAALLYLLGPGTETYALLSSALGPERVKQMIADGPPWDRRDLTRTAQRLFRSAHETDAAATEWELCDIGDELGVDCRRRAGR